MVFWSIETVDNCLHQKLQSKACWTHSCGFVIRVYLCIHMRVCIMFYFIPSIICYDENIHTFAHDHHHPIHCVVSQPLWNPNPNQDVWSNNVMILLRTLVIVIIITTTTAMSALDYFLPLEFHIPTASVKVKPGAVCREDKRNLLIWLMAE